MLGVYLPYYIYDSEAKGYFRLTVTTRDNDSMTDYVGARILVKHLPVGATSKVDHRLMQDIEPYDYNEFAQYRASYLAGFVTERKNITYDKADKEAEQRIKSSLADEIAKRYRESARDIYVENEAYEFQSMKKWYVLLPAWMCHVKYKERDYQFLCNGQTGKMAGNLPVSPLKCILYLLLVFIGSDALFILLYFILHNLLFLIIPTPLAFILATLSLYVSIRQLKLSIHHTASSYAEFPVCDDIGTKEIKKKLSDLTRKAE